MGEAGRGGGDRGSCGGLVVSGSGQGGRSNRGAARPRLGGSARSNEIGSADTMNKERVPNTRTTDRAVNDNCDISHKMLTCNPKKGPS